MAHAHADRALAAAESALERSDGDALDGRGDDVDQLDLADGVGLHIEADDSAQSVDGGGDDDLDRQLAAEIHPDPDGSVCIDALAEAFNARDLDALLDLVTEDCETPGLANDIDDFAPAMEDLWHRRPTCLVTRGEHGDVPLGVLWELADGASWWRVATVHVSDVVDGQAGVVEFTDDPALIDEVAVDAPDLDLEEGTRWEEWYEGA